MLNLAVDVDLKQHLTTLKGKASISERGFEGVAARFVFALPIFDSCSSPRHSLATFRSSTYFSFPIHVSSSSIATSNYSRSLASFLLFFALFSIQPIAAFHLSPNRQFKTAISLLM